MGRASRRRASCLRALLLLAASGLGRPAPGGEALHVDDVGTAIAALLRSDVTGAVNIASGRAVAIAEMVALIARTAGRPELVQVGALPDRASEPPLLVADAGRLTDEVGFLPRWTLEEGIADTVGWWREQKRLLTGSVE